MHSPQETQVDDPIGSFRSKATPGGVALPRPAQHEVLLHIVAAANAAVAEDARFVIDGDRRATNRPARAADRPARIARRRHGHLRRHRLELAVAGVLLADARRRMVGHQQLDERGARLLHARHVGLAPSSPARTRECRTRRTRARRRRRRRRGRRRPASGSADGTAWEWRCRSGARRRRSSCPAARRPRGRRS